MHSLTRSKRAKKANERQGKGVETGDSDVSLKILSTDLGEVFCYGSGKTRSSKNLCANLPSFAILRRRQRFLTM